MNPRFQQEITMPDSSTFERRVSLAVRDMEDDPLVKPFSLTDMRLYTPKDPIERPFQPFLFEMMKADLESLRHQGGKRVSLTVPALYTIHHGGRRLWRLRRVTTACSLLEQLHQQGRSDLVLSMPPWSFPIGTGKQQKLTLRWSGPGDSGLCYGLSEGLLLPLSHATQLAIAASLEASDHIPREHQQKYRTLLWEFVRTLDLRTALLSDRLRIAQGHAQGAAYWFDGEDLEDL
jgi:hypothetical protein